MIVHPGREPEGIEWIAMKRLRDQLGRRVFPIHRLDRPTTGVMLFALDKKTAGLTQQIFEQRNVTKTYHAIVCGSFPAELICDSPLKADSGDGTLSAKTAFERLAETASHKKAGLTLSLIQAIPFTGRFHQIRRHLLEAGFPVVGDFRYAGMERSFELCSVLEIGPRMLLQARKLEFKHPVTGGDLKIEALTDPEFLKIFPDEA